jgi:RNA polymerase sigma-70 factor (ECF subfamily)
MTMSLAALDVSGLSDWELAERVRHGDERAFELVMRRHNRLLYRTARAIVRDDCEAEDCVQEAYLQGFRSIAAFRGESKLSTWLTRIVVNQALGKMRKRKQQDGDFSWTMCWTWMARRGRASWPNPSSPMPPRSANRSQAAGGQDRPAAGAFRTVSAAARWKR